jgi:hypothetical protein
MPRTCESADEAFIRRGTDNLRSLCCIVARQFPSRCDSAEFPDVDCDEVYPDVFLGNA